MGPAQPSLFKHMHRLVHASWAGIRLLGHWDGPINLGLFNEVLHFLDLDLGFLNIARLGLNFMDGPKLLELPRPEPLIGLA